MPYSKLNRSFIVLALLISFCSCKKFLDQKPSIKQVVPHTLNDLQLMFNASSLNQRSNSLGYAELLADDYYITDADYQSFSARLYAYTDNYIWAPNAFSLGFDFWDKPYANIYIFNVVLDQLPKMEVAAKDTIQAKTLKGTGLFFRSFAFWGLAQVFARPYATEYFSSPGIVLRLTSDASVPVRTRATVKETYDQIIADLKEAATLLPVNTSIPTSPNQTAAYAMLSRVYLSMRDYANAGMYANLALGQKSQLFDYNQVQPTPGPTDYSFSFPNYSNPEMIFDNTCGGMSVNLTSLSYANVDSTLYQSYSSNDLRQPIFFRQYNGYFRFWGSYNNLLNNTADNVCDGLATDELYLTRAESSARAGNKDSAMNDLNRLLSTRWATGTYTDMTAVSAEDALNKVLIERRKELVHRGLRWMDIRRLNLEGANITLKRVALGTTYILPPNDRRSVMLIPQTEIDMSGIQQNPR